MGEEGVEEAEEELERSSLNVIQYLQRHSIFCINMYTCLYKYIIKGEE